MKLNYQKGVTSVAHPVYVHCVVSVKAGCWRVRHAVWIAVLSLSPAVTAQLVCSPGVHASWSTVSGRLSSGAGDVISGTGSISASHFRCFRLRPQSRPVNTIVVVVVVIIIIIIIIICVYLETVLDSCSAYSYF